MVYSRRHGILNPSSPAHLSKLTLYDLRDVFVPRLSPLKTDLRS